MSTPSPTRGASRRDAQRDLELVLVAADRVFAARGLGATLEEAASAAGVGVATIHRRFPSKEALVQAVFDQKIQSGVDLVAECLHVNSGWDGLCSPSRRNRGTAAPSARAC